MQSMAAKFFFAEIDNYSSKFKNIIQSVQRKTFNSCKVNTAAEHSND